MDNKDYWDKVTEDTTIEWLRTHKLLSVRASNILIRGAIYMGGGVTKFKPIKTVKELLEVDEYDLKPYRNMGAHTLEEIRVFKEKFLEKRMVQHFRTTNEPITEKGQVDWVDGYKVGYKDGAIAVMTRVRDNLGEIIKELLDE